jgi:KipI family sensor histidine kinase inhibitor
MGRNAGIVFTAGHEEAQSLAEALRSAQLEGVEDIVPAADSVGILVDPERSQLASVLTFAAGLTFEDRPRTGRVVEVEVCFDGADLGAVADFVALDVAGVVSHLAAATLRVGWLGFMPGFAYLVGLPDSLASVPRMARPRARVPAGSFALAGGYAGIYPRASPGGWNVLGRTAVRLFDADRPEPASLVPGDVVRLRPVASLVSPEPGPPEPGPPEPGPPERRAISAAGPRRISVLDAGTLTLIEDLGRVGMAHLGVGRSGPADPLRHRIANLAVGNPATSAVLEITASGPTLRFDCDAHVALVGTCSLRIDGQEAPPASVHLVEAGQTVSVGTVRQGLRSYLAVSGGIETPLVLASRATDARFSLWPGPLRRGDELDLGTAGRPRGRFFEPAFGTVLGVEEGPDGCREPAAAAAFQILLDHRWEVTPDSDRVGTRLRPTEPAGARVAADAARRLPPIASRATVTGAVQLPPDGCPIILGPEHGTVGGYPIVAVLTPSSESRGGQLRPGEVVSFDAASSAPSTVAAQAAQAVAGWMPTNLGG